MSTHRPVRVAIIGAGFSGICLGIHLAKAGIEFTILEKASSLGGTWRDNTYPGAACDVPSFSYCFSFEQKTDWTRKWSNQPEILAYMEHCAEKYGLLPHMRFDTEVESGRFDEAAGQWNLELVGGETVVCEVLISGTGQLNRPHVPKIPGLEDFQGETFHSARWNHELDLTGTRVGVIGNAASAVQFVPEIAKQVEHLDIYQRSANWMMTRGDRAYTEKEKQRLSRHPWFAKAYRWWIWASLDARWPVFRGNEFMGRRIEAMAIEAMRETIDDPELQEALIPKYPFGGKRALVADDYYPTLNRDNVDVVLSPIEKVHGEGVRTEDGEVHPADVLILATGFDSTAFLAPMQLEGSGGARLDQAWADGAEAYLGMGVSGFPNFFMTYGPNTNLGHNSIIFMIECQTNYIVDCIQQMKKRRLRSLEVKPEVQRAFNDEIQGDLNQTVWAAPDRSWYKNAAGKITNNWSASTLTYWRRTRRVDLANYLQRPI